MGGESPLPIFGIFGKQMELAKTRWPGIDLENSSTTYFLPTRKKTERAKVETFYFTFLSQNTDSVIQFSNLVKKKIANLIFTVVIYVESHFGMFSDAQ